MPEEDAPSAEDPAQEEVEDIEEDEETSFAAALASVQEIPLGVCTTWYQWLLPIHLMGGGGGGSKLTSPIAPTASISAPG